MESDERVVVIGGGSTGTGIARDLAMRGVQTTLIEMDDLASGSTGRCHGLLHSGGERVLRSRFVINAAGAWGGKIAGMAGIPLELVLSKRTLDTGRLASHIKQCRFPLKKPI